MESQELEILSKFEKDSAWFYKNVEILRNKGFTNKFVAIKDSEPIASDRDIDKLIKEVEDKGENPSFLFIEFVHPEGYVLLL